MFCRLAGLGFTLIFNLSWKSQVISIQNVHATTHLSKLLVLCVARKCFEAIPFVLLLNLWKGLRLLTNMHPQRITLLFYSLQHSYFAFVKSYGSYYLSVHLIRLVSSRFTLSTLPRKRCCKTRSIGTGCTSLCASSILKRS